MPWGCKFEDKGDPQNPQTLVPNEQWIPIVCNDYQCLHDAICAIDKSWNIQWHSTE